MKKEKEGGTLLGVGTAYLPVKEIKGEFYVKVSDFTRCMDSMRKELEEENKKLKEELNKYKKQYQHSMGFSDFGGYDEDEHIVKDENTYRDLDL